MLSTLTRYESVYKEINQVSFSKSKEGYFKISYIINQTGRENYAYCTLQLGKDPNKTSYKCK